MSSKKKHRNTPFIEENDFFVQCLNDIGLREDEIISYKEYEEIIVIVTIYGKKFLFDKA